MSTTTADLGVDEVVTDEELDEIVAQALRDADTDLESLRAHAAAGRFDSERQRRAWFVVSGLGRG